MVNNDVVTNFTWSLVWVDNEVYEGIYACFMVQIIFRLMFAIPSGSLTESAREENVENVEQQSLNRFGRASMFECEKLDSQEIVNIVQNFSSSKSFNYDNLATHQYVSLANSRSCQWCTY